MLLLLLLSLLHMLVPLVLRFLLLRFHWCGCFSYIAHVDGVMLLMMKVLVLLMLL
jgi:hypothetical protein